MKNELRSEYLRKRAKMPLEDQLIKSQCIFEKLIAMEEYKKADWLFCYIDMGAEVRTVQLIEKAWADKKRVAVPIAKKDRVMFFVEITNFNNMQKTKMGVTEPLKEIAEQVFPTESTMFIVPGSVFDVKKNRCGYGGGYYDTYTDINNVEKTIGVCYDFQLIEEIFVEEFDRKLYMVVTEKRSIL